jgi:zona occludens toxin (predicted ATPase)
MKKQSRRTAIFTGLAIILLLGIYIAVHQWIFWLLQSFPNFTADALTTNSLNIALLTHLCKSIA